MNENHILIGLQDKSSLKRELHKRLNALKDEFRKDKTTIDDLLFMIDDYLDRFALDFEQWEEI